MNFGFVNPNAKVLPILPNRRIRNIANRFKQLNKKNFSTNVWYCKEFQIRAISSDSAYIAFKKQKVYWSDVLFFKL